MRFQVGVSSHHYRFIYTVACLFAGISAKQVQIILEDLRQEVERQSANKNNGIIAASHTSAPCQPIHCFLNTWLYKQIFIACLAFRQLP